MQTTYTKDTLKADLLCKLERADQELQMGLEWDDNGLINAALEDYREVLSDIRQNESIQFEGKEKMLRKAEKDLKALSKKLDTRKSAGKLRDFHEQVLGIVDQW
ncbi:MAG: hypothetical protein AB7F31_02870 [Parachlamydiales bacterium]